MDKKNKLEVFRIAWQENTLSYKKKLKTVRFTYFMSLLEEKNTTPIIYSIQWLNYQKNITSAGADTTQQHSSNYIMNITYKIKPIRDKTVAMQLLATVSHQIVHYRSPEEQFSSFSSIGNEELYKLVKSSKPC